MRATLVLLALVACSAGRPAAGRERGPCEDNRGCDLGLECWSQVCVRPPGADCTAVGERLATHRLGNYASPADRAPVVTQLAGQCQQARLTATEGACIVDATSDDEIGRCPRALLAELDGDKRGCEKVGDHVAAITRRELTRRDSLRSLLGPVIEDLGPTIAGSCTEDRWSTEAKDCVLAATGYDDGEACLARLAPADRRALERRLTLLVKRGMAQPSRTLVDPPDAGVASGLPPECDRYLAMMDKLIACPTMPDAAKDGMRQGRDAMRDGWRQMGTPPPEAYKAMGDACRQAVDALAQSMQAVGCPP